ncbi:hypothetical protein P3T76_014948 [Phytophthora citrophthora]|uniref:Uncharacterized protein n=1 Tax=Phytophthora citrophthora TaxID=4793 RepID=A0AAD9G0F4_9STRA|nr:hypothetical protein P3T76_014948 [Phytophthora citrophthora]
MLNDDALLADMASFLDGHEAPIELCEADFTRELLLDGDQLLAETEALLNDVDTSHSNFVQTKSARAAKRRLKYRNKVKNERESLAEEEMSLSVKVEELQRARKRAKALAGDTLATSTWKAIAIRQKEGRVVAEEQQRRLQLAVENRERMIEEIGKVIQERMSASKRTLEIEATKQSNAQLDEDDAVLFEDFLHDLDVIYPRTDEIFRACGAEENPTSSYRLGPERKRDGDVEYIDNLDVLLIPFTFEQTCATMWESMVNLYRQKNWDHYDVDDPKNIVAAKAHVHVLSESGETANMIVHYVVRRYVEDKRVVMVWRALSEGEGQYTGIHSDESGWCVVRPNDSDEPLMRTVMQTFVRFTPLDITKATNCGVSGFQFTKLIVTSVEEDGAEIARMMDSLLLEDLVDKGNE